ncbi:MAG: methyltransferase domain-containing protein [Acholeplasmataceae bacterium]|nr:methyltransferase domain-containing protein [Acidaminococcaceae bacterium]NLY84596.1 methyltransferase domain-containing protein [Acholeplasmataceae bacterium]
MKDNRTSQPAAEYDGNIEKTMPYYAAFHERTLDLIEVIKPAPAAWLDTGAGTGTFVKKALARFPEASFVAADPSSAMLKIAKVKLAGADCAFVQQPTEELALPDDSFDVVTAILSHHYYSAAAGKKKAVANCLRMLKPQGVYVSFESFLPATQAGMDIALACWRKAQLAAGKEEKSVDKYLSRCGTEFFPATLTENVRLLQETGFSVVELFWLSGMQAGIYAIK